MQWFLNPESVIWKYKREEEEEEEEEEAEEKEEEEKEEEEQQHEGMCVVVRMCFPRRLPTKFSLIRPKCDIFIFTKIVQLKVSAR